jgi:hypothetical protein
MSEPLWVIQPNVFKEENYEIIYESLDRAGINFQIVDIEPFTRKLTPEVNHDGPIMVYGSALLTKIAIEREWKPGTFSNENFRHEAWVEHWGKECLNYDAKVFALNEAEFEGLQFVRPSKDLKSFSGQMVEGERFPFWREKLLAQSKHIPEDTNIIVAPLKNILTETRFFSANGAVITGSIYRIGRNTIYKSDYAPQARIYAEQMIKIWQPADAFVIDVALMEDGNYKIIETNCINCSGFYHADISKVIQTLDSFMVETSSS